MIPRIKHIVPLPDFVLHVVFDDGKDVCYNVKDDIDAIPEFKPLETTCGLWNQAMLDTSRTCVYWNDRIDIASDTIYEYGMPASNVVIAP